MLELKPNEFWQLTPIEFKELLEGYQARLETQKELLAWTQANIMNVHIKKRDRVTIDKLLGRKKKVMSKEEVQAKVIELEKRRKEG